MDDWQYPRKSERAREGAREREGGSETDKEIDRESQSPFCILQVATGQMYRVHTLYLNKTVGKRRERERDIEICTHDWQYGSVDFPPPPHHSRKRTHKHTCTPTNMHMHQHIFTHTDTH